jgi:hypothetical protein
MSLPVVPPSAELLGSTSPLAAELLKIAWSQAQDANYRINYESGLPPDKQRLLRLLREQRFLTKLALGGDSLPDPVGALNPLLTGFLGITRPKNISQHAIQIISLLDWFVEPHGSPPLGPLISPQRALMTGVFAVAVILIPGIQFWGAPVVFASPIFLVIVFLTLGLGTDLGRVQNAYALYLYLYHELSDTENSATE